MPNRELVQTLQHLRDELARTPQLDDEARAALASLTADIDRVLAGDETVAKHAEPLPNRVHDLLLGFESEHPHLTRALNQVADALANLGI